MDLRNEALESVVAPIGYLAVGEGAVRYRTYLPATGRRSETPPKRHYEMPIYDCRPVASRLSLDVEGFALLRRASAIEDFYDDALVRREYLPEVERVLREATGAAAVFAFDHNVRSAKAATETRAGVREPVDMAHNDYTESSGPRRIREILAERGRMELAEHPAALVNAWRPIRGPVRDVPLTVCEARSVAESDFVATPIEHYRGDDFTKPSHSGEIYSFRHRPEHRWCFVRDMQPDEALLLKCFDTRRDGRARYTAHTGFVNPECPPGAPERESIEVRTLVVFDRSAE
jgi:hypothetical protein